jgi:hypothetical protein
MRTKVTAVLVVIALAATGFGVLSGVATGSTENGWSQLGGWASVNRTSSSTAASSPRAPRVSGALVIHRLWHVSTFRVIDLVGPKDTPNAGDSYVFGGPLFDESDSHAVGFLSGHCTFTDPRVDALAECEVTATPQMEGPSLADGPQITLQGWNDSVDVPTFRSAINGGTRQFQNARGQMIAAAGDPMAITFSIIP